MAINCLRAITTFSETPFPKRHCSLFLKPQRAVIVRVRAVSSMSYDKELAAAKKAASVAARLCQVLPFHFASLKLLSGCCCVFKFEAVQVSGVRF